MIAEKYVKEIVDSLQVKNGESIVLIKDYSSNEIVDPLYGFLRKTNDVVLVNLDKYKRPLEKVPKDLLEIMKDKDICFYAIDKISKGGVDESIFRQELCNVVEDAGSRVGNILCGDEEVVESVFSGDREEITKFTKRIYDYMQNVSKVRVTSKEGTDVIFSFDSKYKWLSSTGYIIKGKIRNVFPAEVFTYPANVNGKIVVTGTYAYLTSLPEFKDYKKILETVLKNPITFVIKEGKILDVSCYNKDIERTVKERVFDIDKNGDRIGEFGLGTNYTIENYLGVIVNDEKKEGLHVAHGHGYPKATGADYESKIHYDSIIIEPTIVNLDDDKIIMKDGKYTLFSQNL